MYIDIFDEIFDVYRNKIGNKDKISSDHKDYETSKLNMELKSDDNTKNHESFS